MRCINLMTLYQPQPCVKGLQAHMTIREVENRPEKRLTRTLGNVNFTDLWLEQIDVSGERHSGYVAQHFSLLCDKSGEDELENFWKKGCGQKILISLIKVQAGIPGQTLKVAEERILERAVGGRVFRTLDNADLVLIYFSDEWEALERLRNDLQNDRRIGYYSFYSVEGNFYFYIGPKDRHYHVSELYFPSDPILIKNSLKEQKWCNQMIKDLETRISKCTVEKNKKWASYYHAIVQIVNVLGQYEQVYKFKDLFYIFFPTLQLFVSQLDAGKNLIEEYDRKGMIAEKYDVMQKVEIAVSDFIDAMENLLHHTGISCLSILNADGRNGLAYDISIRMCLMYLSVLYAVAESLNDTEFVYRFFLSPLAYSRPETRIFDFGLEPKSRLIRVELAKHQFYSPRSLICISAHEVGHYVGRSARLRRERAKMYLNMAVSCLVETLLPEEKSERILKHTVLEQKAAQAFKIDWEKRKESLWLFFQEKLGQDLKAKNTLRAESSYYLDDIYLDICESIKRTLYEVNAGPELFFNEVSVNLKEKLQDEAEYNNLLLALNEEYVLFRDNVFAVAISDELFDMLADVKNVLKEIYADCGAVLLIQMEAADYLESYLLSEGCIPDEDILNDMVIHRVAMVNYLMSEKSKDWKRSWSSIKENTWENCFLYKLKSAVDQYQRTYLDDIEGEGVNRVAVQIWALYGRVPEEYLIIEKKNHKFNPFREPHLIELELAYLKKASDLLSEKIECEESKIHVGNLRDLYENFKVRDKNQESDYGKFFGDMEKIIDAYRVSVVNEWENLGIEM